jgi:hypothetical protein
MNYQEDIAQFYGFNSYGELLEFSRPLPKLPEDKVQSYVARRPGGYWFIWDDQPPPDLTEVNHP